jgi:hypothetical protein
MGKSCIVSSNALCSNHRIYRNRCSSLDITVTPLDEAFVTAYRPYICSVPEVRFLYSFGCANYSSLCLQLASWSLLWERCLGMSPIETLVHICSSTAHFDSIPSLPVVKEWGAEVCTAASSLRNVSLRHRLVSAREGAE